MSSSIWYIKRRGHLDGPGEHIKPRRHQHTLMWPRDLPAQSRICRLGDILTGRGRDMYITSNPNSRPGAMDGPSRRRWTGFPGLETGAAAMLEDATSWNGNVPKLPWMGTNVREDRFYDFRKRKYVKSPGSNHWSDVWWPPDTAHSHRIPNAVEYLSDLSRIYPICPSGILPNNNSRNWGHNDGLRRHMCDTDYCSPARGGYPAPPRLGVGTVPSCLTKLRRVLSVRPGRDNPDPRRPLPGCRQRRSDSESDSDCSEPDMRLRDRVARARAREMHRRQDLQSERRDNAQSHRNGGNDSSSDSKCDCDSESDFKPRRKHKHNECRQGCDRRARFDSQNLRDNDRDARRRRRDRATGLRGILKQDARTRCEAAVDDTYSSSESSGEEPMMRGAFRRRRRAEARAAADDGWRRAQAFQGFRGLGVRTCAARR